MKAASGKPQLLFSYGTLRQSNVQIAIFGRELIGRDAIVIGYKLHDIEITDADVIAKSGKHIHQIMVQTDNLNDEIIGTVFDLSDEQISIADAYEVDDYKRVLVPLKSGEYAWAYVAK